MLAFFLKILMTAVVLAIVMLAFYLLFRYLAGRLASRRQSRMLQPLINDGLFDPHTVHRATANYKEPGFIAVDPRRNSAGKPKRSGSLTRLIDRFLENPSGPRLILISGGPGSGKTSFLIHYYLRNQLKPETQRDRIAIIPMKLKDATQRIAAIGDRPSTVLFLDGLNENVAIFKTPHRGLAELIRSVQDFKGVVMTCETGFIPTVHPGRNRNGYKLIADIDDVQSDFFAVREVRIAPSGIRDAVKLIESDLPFWKNSAARPLLGQLKKFPGIKLPPLILTYLGSLFPDPVGIKSNLDLYAEIIAKSMAVETHWTDKTDLMKIMDRLAVDIYLNRFERGEEALQATAFNAMCKSMGIEPCRFANHKGSVITETRDGKISFSHPAFMEFLFIRQLVQGNPACFDQELTHNMRQFLIASLPGKLEESLKKERIWLSGLRLKAHGIKPDTASGTTVSFNLFNHVVARNRTFAFLSELDRVLANPIYYEFGWDPQLPDSLMKAINEEETTLLKLSRPRRVLFIDGRQIEITNQDQNKYRILINRENVAEYVAIEKKDALMKLGKAIGLEGMKRLSAVNGSGLIALLPNLSDSRSFTLYFLLNTTGMRL